MKIEFQHQGKAYLPEIWAYEEFLRSRGHEVVVATSHSPQGDSDVVWQFVGSGKSYPGRITVHEYGSLSTGSFPKIKDFVKTKIAATPNGRVFLNSFVRSRLGFNDKVPHLLRDMGVHKSFYLPQQKTVEPEFDFIYSGSVTKSRLVDRFCRCFAARFPDHRLALIGQPEDDIYREFYTHRNIHFLGRQEYRGLHELYGMASYGVNLAPARYPYSYQSATKVLEYCAAGLKVVSTGGEWINRFMLERGAKFFLLRSDLSNFNSEALERAEFLVPDVSDLEWQALLDRIGLNQWFDQLSSGAG